MTLRKRIFSVFMAMLMILSVVQIGVSAIDVAAGETVESTQSMTDNGTGRIVLPTATVTASPTIRVAGKSSSYGDYIVGTTIVKATPSGVAETSGNYAKEAYSGETPEYATVTFECDLSLAKNDGSVSLSCPGISNMTVEGGKVNNNKWEWRITGGTVAAGSTVDFEVSFSYTYTDTLTGKTITKDYKAYTSSYVDNVAQPAGMYMKANRTQSFHSDALNGFVARILGINTKGSYYESGGDSGGTDWSHGVYDFQTLQAIAWNITAATYPNGGLVLHEDAKCDGGNDSNTSLDRQRPVSSTYIDSSRGTALNGSNINLRYALFDWQDVDGRHDNDSYDSYLNGITVLPGEQSASSSSSNDATAANELNFGLANGSKTSLKVKGSYQTSNEFAITNSADSGKVYALNVPFKGTAYYNSSNMTTLDDGNKYISYTFLNTPGIRYYSTSSGRMVDITNAINLRFYVYDKSSLRGSIEDALSADNHIPTSPTYSNPQIGVTPQSWYYTSESWNTYITALKAAQRVNAKYITSQSEINTAVTNLDAAVDGLVVATADYTAANILLHGDADQQIVGVADKDATLYTEDSWAAVSAAQRALGDMNYTVFYQPLVDDLTADLQTAIDNLVYEDADFSRVDTAINYANSVAPSQGDYTTASWNALNDLITLANSADFRALNITNQAYIDQVADQIYAAVDALQYADADYTEINALVAEYNTLKANESIYTTSSWGVYEGAIESVIYGIKKNQQFLVDEMADDIVVARNKLAYKGADYTAVNAAIREANALTKSNYTTASWNALQNAINAVDEELLAPDQAIVDGYAADIRAAINALEYAAGDYSAVVAQKERYEDLNKDWYTQASKDAVEAAIDAVVEGLKKNQQSTIDGYAANIKTAIDNLVLLPADYTQANAQIARYNAINRSLYTTGSLATAMSAYNTLNQNMNLTIDKQSTVDAYTNSLKTAIDNLAYKSASYTSVNSAISNANALLAAADQYAAANNGNPYYTPASRQALETAVSAVVTGLTIDKQSQVDGYATAINNAIAALALNTADYTAVNAAKASVPADLEGGRYVAEKVAAVKNAVNAVEEGLLADEQAIVDGYAAAITAAVNDLALNGADYTAVEAAIASKPADLTPYTVESVQNLNNKINAVVYGLTIDDQATVDGYAAAIRSAIDALQLDKADYTAVNTAVAAANTALASEEAQYYTDASKTAVTNAINAVVYDLAGSEQARVNGFATAINNAVAALEYKPINTDAYYEAVDRYNAVQNKSNYTDASIGAVTSKISEAGTFLAGNVNIKNQAALDAIVADINTAIDNLALKGADYTAVNEAKATAATLAADKALYVDFSGVETAVAAVVEGLTIDQQATVDGYALAINNAIAALAFKDIDTAAYVAAKATIPADLSIYTDASVQAVNNQIIEIDTFLAGNVDIRNQAELDSKVAALNTKIAALAKKSADYTALNDVIAEFLDLNEDDYSNYEDAYDVYASVRTWKTKNGNLKIDSQSLVDAQTALLREAIDSLIGRPIDTAAYVAAKATIPADLTVYTDATVQAVNDQVAAIDTFLAGDVDFRDQATLDAMVADLNTKIAALAYKPADYTALNAVMAEFLDIDETLYSNYDDAYDVYATVRSWKNSNSSLMANNQSLIDEKTALLRAAIDGLTPVTPQEPEEYFKAREGSTTKIATNGQITGLKTELTRGDLENIFLDTNVANITFKKAVKSARYYGTGSTITVNYSNGTTEVYTIVVYGDVDGNGIIDYDDAALTDSATEDSTILGSAQSKAANVDGVRRVTANDAAIIYLAAQGLVLDQLNPSNIG